MRKFYTAILFLAHALAVFAQSNDLQSLIDRTPDGGTLTIAPGTYVLDASLIISGKNGFRIEGKGQVKILCSDVWQDVLKIEESQSVRIGGIYFSHEKPLKEYQCNGGVIDIRDSQKILVEDCELEGSGTIGVAARNVNDLTVDHCYIHDNTFNAFYIQDCDEVLLTSNFVQNNANFIQLYKTDGFEMSDNIINGNGGYWRDKDTKPGLRIGVPTKKGKE